VAMAFASRERQGRHACETIILKRSDSQTLEFAAAAFAAAEIRSDGLAVRSETRLG